MAVTYKKINAKLQGIIASDCPWVHGSPYRCDDGQIVRRDPDRDKASLWRPAFVRDIEKIMHLPFYNRYADKTQVFSFYRNDDITRRGLHVQLVSRIARNIGRVLGLNQDLIEAIALGHDIGHTPFGHAGERYLSQLLEAETGKFFHHNVQSVRVLEKFSPEIFLCRHWMESYATTENLSWENIGRLQEVPLKILIFRQRRVLERESRLLRS